ncbi:MAG TPA: trigger factor [Salinimicrobium sp.]|nr:trigger factor [Salinimicrobium sp.]
MNISRENIDELNAVVKVDIAKEDYSNKVDKILKDYRKNANIPGFRKGHVPMGMVQKQYGKAVLVDEVNKLLQDALNKYLTEEKLDVLGNPLPKEQDNFDWNNENYSFEFELGLSPEFEVNLNPEKPIVHYKIVAGEEMVDSQVKRIREQYGKLISKDVVEESDQITGTVKNEAEEIENTPTLSLENLKGEENKTKFIGKKPGDTVALETKNLFEDEHELISFLKIDHDKAHDLDIEVEFEISEVNHQELADLNQELFDKAFGEGEVSSEEEMREKIKEGAAKQFEQQGDQQLLNDVTEMLIENTQFELPKEFLQKWIQTTGEKPMTSDEAKEEYEKSEKGLRFQLIEGKLIKDNDLEVKFEDLKSFAKDRVKEQMAQFGQMNPSEEELENIAMRILSNQDEVKRLSEQLMNQKLLNLYKEKVNLEPKEVTFEEFAKEVYK